MAIKYEWKITALKKAPSLNGLSDVITHINFEYKGTKGSGSDKIEAVFNGACPVGPPDSNDFKEFAKLTEADVLAWAKANHPVENMQDVISKTIADKETPKNVEVETLPWDMSTESSEDASNDDGTSDDSSEDDSDDSSDDSSEDSDD